jgi:hypothetical protein
METAAATMRLIRFFNERLTYSLAAWYQVRMAELKLSPLMRFFNERRTHSIHKGVVNPTRNAIPIYNLTVDGERLPGPGTAHVLRFEGVEEVIPGDSGNVFRLCEQYFLLLKGLVAEWRAKRHELNVSRRCLVLWVKGSSFGGPIVSMATNKSTRGA